MPQCRIFSSLFLKKYAWSCQVYYKANSPTLEIIQKQLLRNFPLDRIIRAQLGLKASRTFKPVPITLFKGLKGSYKLQVKNEPFEHFLVL